MKSLWVGCFLAASSFLAFGQALAELKSGQSTTQSFEMGPMKVRVLGDVAEVTGSDTEKSTYPGKDSSGKYTARQAGAPELPRVRAHARRTAPTAAG